MAIALAANPKLPVVLIRDGSLLDEDGLRMVAEMAEARGAQVWLERVSNAGNVGVVIEDGRVKEIPTLPVEAMPARTHTEDQPAVLAEADPKGWPTLELSPLEDLPAKDHVNLGEGYTMGEHHVHLESGDDMQEFAPGPGGHEDDGELI